MTAPPAFFNHFVNSQQGVDTATLAAHDFDVDNRTGFMPPDAPTRGLPSPWNAWEDVLEDAIEKGLTLADKPDITLVEETRNMSWRERVLEMSTMELTNEVLGDEVLARRAHKILSWMMHFFIHTLPLSVSPVHIPSALSIPLLQVSRHLLLPPVLTYSDDVLYNWRSKEGSEELECIHLFTGTNDEAEFYLTSARMELRGVEALTLMRMTLDELFLSDDIAILRITSYLIRLATVISELKDLLMKVREGCDPEVFYQSIRPWFKGQDSSPSGRPWIFDGVAEQPTELSGPSAGQSALIHALDVFLSVDEQTHAGKKAFLDRMVEYMPKRHRAFLRHLGNRTTRLRSLVLSSGDEKLKAAYNGAIQSLKELRDAHFVIVTQYIIQPAARERKRLEGRSASLDKDELKGTGGTDLAKFLKSVRDGTARTIIKD